MDRALFTTLLTTLLGGCHLLIDVEDTDEVPASTITVRADGLVEPVAVRLTAVDVDETISVVGDGDFTFAAQVTPAYSVTLVDAPPCAFGPNPAGSVDGSPVVIDLACLSSTRLTALELDTLLATLPIAVDDATTTYQASLRELQSTTRITATPRSANATVSIDGQAAMPGAPLAIPLASGAQTVTIVVDHPLSDVLRSTYVLQLARSAPAFVAYSKAFPTLLDTLGWATSTDGTRYVTGAPNEDSATDPSNPADTGATNSGAAYVFVRQGETWTYEGYAKAPNADADDEFGFAVALDGDRLVVTAPFEDSGSNNLSDNNLADAGAAYVYRHEPSGWVFEQYLKSPNPKTGGLFGHSVAIDGDTIAVGSFAEDFQNGATPIPSSGQVHVFRRSGTTWTREQTLGPDLTTGAGDHVGYAVAVRGDRLIAGAVGGHPTISGAGAARIYTRSGTTWTFEQQVVAADATRNDFFGAAVAIEGTTALVTAPQVLHETTGAEISALPGAAYVFDKAATWAQTAKLNASNADADDEFGRSAALAGNVIAVSALREDGSGAGIGPVSNNNADGAGAVYLFERSGGAWTQSRYVKATNPDPSDGFGTSLAMSSSGVLVIGAAGESSLGAPSNNGAQSTGACYVLH